jgi:7-keto-8-aminopelargonate synthetase-like enzyme
MASQQLESTLLSQRGCLRSLISVYQPLTPPPSRASQSTSSSWLATPHTLRQLQKQASSVKKQLKHRSQSPLTPSELAIQQLIKGCEMAMHSAALLAKENRDLRAANEKEKQKSKMKPKLT